MRPDLTDDDKVVLVDLLRETIRGNRFLVSPRIRRLEAILDKLDPTGTRPEPLPPSEPSGRLRTASAKKPRR
jgi:hypothetical protein